MVKAMQRVKMRFFFPMEITKNKVVFALLLLSHEVMSNSL